MLRSLEQKRANYAWKCIQKIKELGDEKVEKNYNSYVKKTPFLIQNNGLGNALAFYKSKKESAYELICEHLNKWFKMQKKNDQEILDWIISENTSSTEVFQVTKEILALLSWMKRFAEAELKEGE